MVFQIQKFVTQKLINNGKCQENQIKYTTDAKVKGHVRLFFGAASSIQFRVFVLQDKNECICVLLIKQKRISFCMLIDYKINN